MVPSPMAVVDGNLLRKLKHRLRMVFGGWVNLLREVVVGCGEGELPNEAGCGRADRVWRENGNS